MAKFNALAPQLHAHSDLWKTGIEMRGAQGHMYLYDILHFEHHTVCYIYVYKMLGARALQGNNYELRIC
jgi:hypothetical protein